LTSLIDFRLLCTSILIMRYNITSRIPLPRFQIINFVYISTFFDYFFSISWRYHVPKFSYRPTKYIVSKDFLFLRRLNIILRFFKLSHKIFFHVFELFFFFWYFPVAQPSFKWTRVLFFKTFCIIYRLSRPFIASCSR